ncbi:MAG: hypothetical protein Kow0049_01830 [Stanieria sp.]
MISSEQIKEEYLSIINDYYPDTSRLLVHCYVKVLQFYLVGTNKNYYYLGIYYPENLGEKLIARQSIFREIAANMGLIEVVMINANRLVRDPFSKFRQEYPRFWLELTLIASQSQLEI